MDKQKFLDSLRKTEEEISRFEESTRGKQVEIPWEPPRRLNASQFGKITKLLAKTSREKSAKHLLIVPKGEYAEDAQKKAQDRKRCVDKAKKDFSSREKKEIRDCGLYQGKGDDCIYMAKPDGLIGEDAIVVIKICTPKARNMSVKDAIQQEAIAFAALDQDGNLVLKEDDNIMFKIQGQLHLTDKKECYFIVWTEVDFMYQKVIRNQNQWVKMEPTLRDFYLGYMLPELVTVYSNEFDAREQAFLDSLKQNDEEILRLEEATRQHPWKSPWKAPKRLNASRFGYICNQPSTSPEKTAKYILSVSDEDYASNIKKKLEEKERCVIRAKTEFASQENLEIRNCGVFVGKEDDCIFYGKPDGLIGEDAVVVIKVCPQKGRHMTVEEAIQEEVITFATLDQSGNLVVKEDDNIMYKIQGQLHLAGKKDCYFIVWTDVDLKYQKISRKQEHWVKMEPKLRNFYLKYMLPELVTMYGEELGKINEDYLKER